jgi:phosphopantetheinyl transferase
VQLPPAEVRFRARPCAYCGAPHGKPEIADGRATVRFSLSHSHEMALVAVSEFEVGVDLEWAARAVEADPLAASVLTPHELRNYDETPPERRRRVLVTAWTRKEAVAKAVGAGLHLPFPRIRIDEAARSATIDANGAQPRVLGWADVAFGQYVAAVAVDSPRCAVRLIPWTRSTSAKRREANTDADRR